jgi:regulator of nucleoside diphosphate kinase
MPSHVVNVGSEVTFRDNTTGRVQTVILVLPKEANIAERRVSVLTPIGAALIGLAEGASIDWSTRDGEARLLTVLQVTAAASIADAHATAEPDAAVGTAQASL